MPDKQLTPEQIAEQKAIEDEIRWTYAFEKLEREAALAEQEEDFFEGY